MVDSFWAGINACWLQINVPVGKVDCKLYDFCVFICQRWWLHYCIWFNRILLFSSFPIWIDNWSLHDCSFIFDMYKVQSINIDWYWSAQSRYNHDTTTIRQHLLTSCELSFALVLRLAAQQSTSHENTNNSCFIEWQANLA
jgi:hypothetical protein